jgi:pyrimidine-nucleoside phosphorylase
LVGTAKEAGIQATALVTRMDEPLGRMVGNSLEVIESLEILKQKFPSEKAKELNIALTEITLDQVVEMALLCGAKESAVQLKEKARALLVSGAAYKKFCEMAHIQGAQLSWEEKLPLASKKVAIKAPQAGYISQIDSKALGLLAIDLGAGRKRAEDKVDPAVGFELCVGIGDKVEKGQTLMLCHCHDEKWARDKQLELEALFKLTSKEVLRPPNLLLEKIC